MSPKAYFGLGSNLGDRWLHLQAGIDRLMSIGTDVAISRVYETSPIGGPEGQGPYLNCVLGVDTDLEPVELLGLANRLEDSQGRVRVERFGPRTLDVDVLYIEGYSSSDPRLTVPHPRMWERAFVLAPLAELDLALAGEEWEERFGGPEAVAELVRPVGSMFRSLGPVGEDSQ
ncbi:MAG TPA: 2-amino-4-hydroxy-6-hydroxymethyldihydropteridine diphosphokinase [Acidimicrobiales bacterium]|jgi:2-amino-4-hydroxy-6-hydroxymethyldihydropteridine diphosphokinase|nr:2-amino-4-hydroxy-6-hydroxymethyldihydropteridine diphosphokinase [Acidimicrobiales bacterium]